MAKLVERTYGEALFEVAKKENKLDLFLKETQVLLFLLEQNPQLDRFMKHPKISKQEKLQVLDSAFRNNISAEMLGFFKLLIKKERYRELAKILQYLLEKIREEQKIGVAFVTTAVELTEEKKSAIQKRLLETTSYRTMEIHYETDVSIIGGLVIRIKDRIVDSSIRTKLEAMKKQLLQSQCS